MVVVGAGLLVTVRGSWFPAYSALDVVGFPSRAMIGGLMVLLGARPPRRIAVGMIVAFALGEAFTAGGGKLLGSVMPTGFLGGVGCLLVAAGWGATSPDWRPAVSAMVRTLLLPVFIIDSCFLLDITAHLHPVTLDDHLFAADSQLGFLPEPIVVGLFVHFPLLSRLCESIYLGLPLMLLVVPSLPLKGPLTSEPDFFTEMIAVGAFGYVLYHVVPVCGPTYAFDPHSQLGTPIPIPIRQWEWRNGVPSLHTAWALMIAWQTRRRGKWVYGMGLVFMTLTLLATLGLGEHYLADLAVGCIFAVSVRLALMKRWEPLAVCAGMILGWDALLRSDLVFRSWPSGTMLALLLVSFVLPLLILRREAAQA